MLLADENPAIVLFATFKLVVWWWVESQHVFAMQAIRRMKLFVEDIHYWKQKFHQVRGGLFYCFSQVMVNALLQLQWHSIDED